MVKLFVIKKDISNPSDMFRKIVFLLGHFIFKPRVLWYFFDMKRNESKNAEEIKSIQDSLLKKYLLKCSRDIPRYKENMHQSIKDFPIIQKSEILKNQNNFTPKNIGRFKIGKTGGSTGEPLQYFMSRNYSDLGLAVSYRGWSRGGYSLGDKIAILAGGSLVGKKLTLKSKINNFILNYEKYTSYGMDENRMQSYIDDIKKKNIRFIRGYVSAILELAIYASNNRIKLSFDAVFTTAEMLGVEKRNFIEKTFNTEVFDNYGLNDGGVSAFECREHKGFHIDVERSLLEVVDSNGIPLVGEIGHIVATSYTNFGTRFIRYDTGDLGILDNKPCPCGSPYPLLKELKGRTTDTIRINDRSVGSPVLTVLMNDVNAIKYQFIQSSTKELSLIIQPNEKYSIKDENFIRTSLFSHLGNFNLNFCYDSNMFIYTEADKHNVVVSHI